MRLQPVLDRIDADLEPALDRLLALLRIPSISTDPAYKAQCDAAADWLVADLQSLDILAEKRETPGLFAEPAPRASSPSTSCGFGHSGIRELQFSGV